MRKLSLLLAFLLSVAPAALFADSIKGEIKPAPWSGDWWSRKKGFLVKGWPGHTTSPMAKYDAYVAAITGKNPGAHAWESDTKNHHYNPNAESWEGHCNGWSAAAVLSKEPTIARTRGGIVFETSDQKALLSEQYMNCYCTFHGNRYWGKDTDDRNDIYPDQFHRLLIENIASGKTAMVCDIESDRMVWNYPIYKFESEWSTGWFDDHKLKVKTTCYYVNDDVRPEHIGCKWFAVKYTYNLYVDDKGNVISGEWTGDSKKNHPDFVWIPTSDAQVPANSTLENPRLNPKYISNITTGPANEKTSGRAAAPEARTPDMVLMEAGLNPADLF